MQVMQALRMQIEAGALPGGTYLPAVRKLSKAYGVAANTVLRAVRMLIEQGLLEARPRRGYLILESKPAAVSFAYLMSTQNIYAGFDALYKRLMQDFRNSAGSRGEHCTTIVLNPGDERHTVEQHGLERVNGLVLDTPNEFLIAWARKQRIAAVLIDDVDVRRRVPAAVQDNFGGSLAAAEHLMGAGCSRIAWFGKSLDHHHAQARYGGAAAGLAAAGRSFASEHFLPADAWENPGLLERAAREMLEQRPDGVLAFWLPMAAAVVAAARSLGLKIGTDFRFAGWVCEELHESSYAPLFEAEVPPAVVWSSRRMAELALEALRAAPEFADGAAAATLVPCALRATGARSGPASA
ncbi:MAG: hypothetical protein AMXMBFR7_23040 [Planctomycetota bacterium]